MDEEIARSMEIQSMVAPVFPEQQDFDFLLENKFKTWVQKYLFFAIATHIFYGLTELSADFI